MKKYLLIFGLVFGINAFGQEYNFNHYSIYNGYNGFMNKNFKVIYFGNSNDESIILKFSLSDDLVNAIQLEKEIDNYALRYNFNITPFKYSDFEPQIHLKDYTTQIINNISNLDFNFFDKIEIIENSIKKTVFTIYNNDKKKIVDKKIEIETFVSEKVKKPKFYFVHSRQFIKKNIDFSPESIKSYKMIDGSKILESSLLVEQDTTNFTINLKK